MWVYVGTLGGEGIYVMKMDAVTGQLSAPKIAGKVRRPSFLAIHSSGDFMYSTCELAGHGGVAGFKIDRSTGQLALTNARSAEGKGAAYVGIDHAGKNVLFANYGSGSIGVMRIGDDGKLGEESAFIQHEGKSVNPKRQEGPHAHSIYADPADRFVLTCDLGLDKVFGYRFEGASGKLAANDPPFAKIAPGSGPRHLAFSKDGKFVYVINEMGNTVVVFSYDALHGALTEVQTISTLPADFKGESYCSEVLVHPSGKFLYGANRGHDSIAVFAMDQASGKLESRGQVNCGGKWPRNFGIDPSGKWLLVANEHSNDVAVFAIDQETGGLKFTGVKETVPTPSCVRFLSR